MERLTHLGAGSVGFLLLWLAAFTNACSGNTDNETSQSDGAAGCPGSAGFQCVASCSTDFLKPAECIGGGWKCAPPSIPTTSCPAGTCFTNPGVCCYPDGTHVMPKCPTAYSAECPAGTQIATSCKPDLESDASADAGTDDGGGD
jgi:hypothetical protein